MGNAYWPHLLPKDEKKKLKIQCQVDWDRFMDEEEAEKRQKGVVDDDDEYGNLGNIGMNEDSSSDEDDSDDAPIDDLEISSKEEKEKDDDVKDKEQNKAEEIPSAPAKVEAAE